ncbi:hypothetical protein OEZ86_006578 [Tetradesmus obliquus]|nr:hypothetical protein OEZ86_006578 [Tetradesmus obliquus]
MPGYDTDNDTTTFSNQELSDIVAIWRFVAEDYAPFDVDVTTIEPVGLSSVNISHVCIGGRSSDLITRSLGTATVGIAYVNVFGAASNTRAQPTFVFSQGANDLVATASAVSHEVGHNKGLYHQINESTN